MKPILLGVFGRLFPLPPFPSPLPKTSRDHDDSLETPLDAKRSEGVVMRRFEKKRRERVCFSLFPFLFLSFLASPPSPSPSSFPYPLHPSALPLRLKKKVLSWVKKGKAGKMEIGDVVEKLPFLEP